MEHSVSSFAEIWATARSAPLAPLTVSHSKNSAGHSGPALSINERETIFPLAKSMDGRALVHAG
jgi:hypothetical protein